MRNDQGVLHTVPIPQAMAYLMLRPLLDDVPADEHVRGRAQPDLPGQRALAPAPAGCASPPIPSVQPGDSVWWHCDMIHSVAPVTDQQGWGNVMYIPAAPWCAKNEAYLESVREAFLAGSSPSDFPEEHYEAGLDRPVHRSRSERHRPPRPRPVGDVPQGSAAGARAAAGAGVVRLREHGAGSVGDDPGGPLDAPAHQLVGDHLDGQHGRPHRLRRQRPDQADRVAPPLSGR